MRVELLDINLSHKPISDRCTDLYRTFASGKEAEVARLAESIDKLLRLFVPVLEHYCTEPSPTKIPANIGETPETLAVDLIFFRDITIVGDDAAGC